MPGSLSDSAVSFKDFTFDRESSIREQASRMHGSDGESATGSSGGDSSGFYSRPHVGSPSQHTPPDATPPSSGGIAMPGGEGGSSMTSYYEAKASLSARGLRGASHSHVYAAVSSPDKSAVEPEKSPVASTKRDMDMGLDDLATM